MYDNLLDTNLREIYPNQILSNPGYNSATLVAFADDVAVIATGRNKQLLEETANRALAAVSEWISRNGLTLAAHKTEAVMLTTKRGYGAPTFIVDGVTVEPKENLKYLGVELSRKLGYGQHIKAAAAKAGATADALGRILPNVGGAKQRKRKLLATVVCNQLLYAAPVWASALVFANNVKTLEGPQRKIALRTVMAYRTVSTDAILVVAGLTPAHLVAMESQKRDLEKRQGTVVNMAEERSMTIQKWQFEWENAINGRWTHRLIKQLELWIGRKYGNLDFHTTQMITGHGYFGQYLHKFKRRQSPACVDCGAPSGDAEHTLFLCDRWWQKRRQLEVILEADMVPETIVRKMLENKNKWKAVKEFVDKVLATKEEEERAAEKAAANVIVV